MLRIRILIPASLLNTRLAKCNAFTHLRNRVLPSYESSFTFLLCCITLSPVNCVGDATYLALNAGYPPYGLHGTLDFPDTLPYSKSEQLLGVGPCIKSICKNIGDE